MKKTFTLILLATLANLFVVAADYPCQGSAKMDEGSPYEVEYKISSTYKTATIEILNVKLNGSPISRLNAALVTMQRTGLDATPGEPKFMEISGNTASYKYYGLTEGQEITFRLTVADGTQGSQTPGSVGIKHVVRQKCNGADQNTEDDSDKPVGTCKGTVTLDQGEHYQVDYEIVGNSTSFSFNVLQVRGSGGAVISNLSTAIFETGVDASNNSYQGNLAMDIKGGTASITFTNMIQFQSLNFGLILGTGPVGPGGVQGNLSKENRLSYTVGQGCGGSVQQFDCRGTSRLNNGIPYTVEYYVRSNSTSVTIDVLSIKYNGQLCNNVSSLIIKPSFTEPKELIKSNGVWSAYYGNQTKGKIVSFKFTIEADFGIGTHLQEFGIFHTIGQTCDGETPQPEEPISVCTGTTTLEQGQRYSIDYQIIKQGEKLTVNLTQVRNELGEIQNQLITANIKISYDEYTSMVIHGGKATKSWYSVKESALAFAFTVEAGNSGQGQNAEGSRGFAYNLGDVCGSQTIIPVSGIESNQSIATQVHPTVVDDIINFQSESIIRSIILYSNAGKLIDIWNPSANLYSTDINHLPSGLYFLKIKTDDSIESVVKIIKK